MPKFRQSLRPPYGESVDPFSRKQHPSRAHRLFDLIRRKERRVTLRHPNAYELSVLTGTQVLLLVVSETGLVYTFTTPKLQPLVTKAEGKNLIQACLNAPEPSQGGENGVDDGNQVESPEEPPQQHLPPQAGRQQGMPGAPHMPPNYMPANMGMDPSNLAYGGYVNQQQRGGYPMAQGGLPQHSSHQS
ncbi:hypothetical protein BN1708_003685 [Verticillium longisporum]|uniref:MADS-box domain-containing protein n=1 Tax=Verticillium longisporum TaxID=100787 RepID=A0A0G4LN04_VERLO|nr:hypothetical protein BN1708_003685 [Verticillium longisporum]